MSCSSLGNCHPLLIYGRRCRKGTFYSTRRRVVMYDCSPVSYVLGGMAEFRRLPRYCDPSGTVAGHCQGVRGRCDPTHPDT